MNGHSLWAGTSCSVEFSGVVEKSANGEELVGSVSTSAETCLMFENDIFHPRLRGQEGTGRGIKFLEMRGN